MKISIKKITRTLRFCVAFIVLVAAKNGFADNIIYEGESVPGGLYLGMSRYEVNQIDLNDSNSKNCRSRNKCSMASPADHDAYVNIFFANNIVVQIETAKSGFKNTPMLQTSAGATSRMSPEEVAAIYPGSVIEEEEGYSSRRRVEVIAADRGYTLSSYLDCPPYSFLGPCRHKGVHRIYQPVNGPVDEIDNAFELNNLSGNRSSTKVYTLVAPEGARLTTIKISGGTGDADLYVKKGSAPRLNSYDCRPYRDGNYETCELYTPGTYYIMVRGYTRYSGLSLKGYSE